MEKRKAKDLRKLLGYGKGRLSGKEKHMISLKRWLFFFFSLEWLKVTVGMFPCPSE